MLYDTWKVTDGCYHMEDASSLLLALLNVLGNGPGQFVICDGGGNVVRLHVLRPIEQCEAFGLHELRIAQQQ